MNKTLLLILCDFLLLNILALTRWESVKPPPPAVAQSVAQKSGDAPPVANELVEAMRQTLSDEQLARDQLRSQLESTSANLHQRETDVAGLEKEKNSLQQNLAGTQQQAEKLAQQAAAAAKEIEASKLRLAQLQRDLELQERQAREQKEAYASLEQKHSAARNQIENLNVAVKVAEQEKILLRETLDQTKQEVVAVREEKLKLQEQTGVLVENVGKLAEKSGDLTREIRENRPINPNTLFDDFRLNAVAVDTFVQRRGLLAGPPFSKSARTVLISDGKAVFALIHAGDTAFDIESPSQEFASIRSVLSRGARQFSVEELSFHAGDPRVMLIPVDAAKVAALGVKVYQLSVDPNKFAEAVLISSSGAYYGEIAFKVDPTALNYVQMDSRFFKRLMGDFSPSTGDLVFSKTGELLGLMVNRNYCLVLSQLATSATVKTGSNADGLPTKEPLLTAFAAWRKLPVKLQ